MNPVRIDIWSDVVCPFCYIGKKRLENVARDADIDIDVHWHSYELDPNAPASHGSSNTERLAKKYGKSVAEMEQFQRQMADMARDEGIDFQWQQAKSGNSFNAHRIIHLATSKGLGDATQEAFFYAYMTEGLAIGERNVVEQVAARIGLNPDEVKAVLDSDRFEQEVRMDEQIAREQLEISGVPFFVFNQKIGLSGAQPREVFLQALQQAGDAHNSVDMSQDQTAPLCDDNSCEVPEQK
ncbi:DsbA family protein [Alkanindiges sp. WGS2144]|uniref:DsbA family oxidoreductase n=1 Tax=Alkanindiges sp. WGS2144 TaxID=3366808 RepID=UPI003751F10C